MTGLLRKRLPEWSPRLLEGSDEAPEVGWIAIAELQYDMLRWVDGRAEGYQRPLEEPRLAQMLASYDPRLLGVIVVVRRADGSYWVVDGQHRIELLRRLGRSVVLAEIHTGLTREQEADFYYHLNRDRRTPNRWNQFGSRASSGDPRILAIIELAQGCGFRVGTADRSLSSIAAVAVLERVYGWIDGPRLLRVTLHKITELWPSDVIARDGVFIEGLALLIWNYDGSWRQDTTETIDWKRLDSVFSKTTAREVMRKAKNLKAEQGFTMNPSTYAIAFRDLYNGKTNFTRRLTGKVLLPRATGVPRAVLGGRNR